MIIYLSDLLPLGVEHGLGVLEVLVVVPGLDLLVLLVHPLEVVLGEGLHDGRGVAVSEEVVGRAATVAAFGGKYKKMKIVVAVRLFCGSFTKTDTRGTLMDKFPFATKLVALKCKIEK